MDKQLDKAIMNFYSDLRGIGTEELYGEYLLQCEMDGVEPRPKTVIVREACKVAECAVEKQQQVIVEKFFVPKKDADRRQEWRNRFRERKKG